MVVKEFAEDNVDVDDVGELLVGVGSLSMLALRLACQCEW